MDLCHCKIKYVECRKRYKGRGEDRPWEKNKDGDGEE